MNDFLSNFGNFYKKLCVAILGLMVLIVFTNTVLRYCFHSGIAQAEEILRYLFIWLSFLGIMSVYKSREHISVTLLTERLSPKAAAAMSLLVNALTLAAFAVLISGSVGYMIEAETMVGELTGLPYRVIIAAILLASSVCFVLAVRDLLGAWRAFTSAGNSTQSGADHGNGGR